MNIGLKLTGAAVAACAACCAVSVVPLLLAGTSAVLVGGAIAQWGAVAALLAVPAVGLWALSRRQGAPQATALLDILPNWMLSLTTAI